MTCAVAEVLVVACGVFVDFCLLKIARWMRRNLRRGFVRNERRRLLLSIGADVSSNSKR